METTKLRRFAQYARRNLMEQVSAKLGFVLAGDSAARRENARAVADLEKQISESSQEQVIEKVAYTWFNRFCALRFMDMNGYTRIRVISPADEGQFQPEILAEAKAGHIDTDMVDESVRERISALLSGSVTSSDPQQEAYRLLVVAACNDFHRAMPYLFERIADYTELLMPDDLLSGNSILAYTREAMTPDACQDVEVIGWLYQFYISEKKDEVFEGLKKNKKITPENIPAATQLFTPHWIVRYLVENSLGRLWILNHPNSRLVEKMEYYIAPQEVETDFLRIAKPEDIKLCDPACGSGHMLTYAFDLLYEIYKEQLIDESEIPEKILTHNLYGIEIDERAGELAAFALTMKARAKQRRFFNKGLRPNICVLQTVAIAKDDLDAYVAAVGRDLFTANLRTLLTQFEEVDNFGSLIRPVEVDYTELRRVLAEKGIGSELLLEHVHLDVLRVLEQAEFLSQRYQVVVANPPYMGSKGMNEPLAIWAKEYYSDSKNDLFAMFIERGLDLIPERGYSAMVTMQSWMFLSSYEKLRNRLLSEVTMNCMVHMGNMVMGIAFGTAATVWNKAARPEFKGTFSFVDSTDLDSSGNPTQFPVMRQRLAHVSAAEFQKIPGGPIAYWVSAVALRAFEKFPALEQFTVSDGQNITANNDKFLRNFWELSSKTIGTENKWVFYAKGGDFRNWWGNLEYVVDWSDEARLFYRTNSSARIIPEYLWFKLGVTWTLLSSSKTGFRVLPEFGTFDKTGSSVFFLDEDNLLPCLALLNSKVSDFYLRIFSSTIAYQIKEVRTLPVALEALTGTIKENAEELVRLSKLDWNAYENSWGFVRSSILVDDFKHATLKATYAAVRTNQHRATLQMQLLEEENNRIFIDAYGLQDELTPDVPMKEITLTCNPHYRYGGKKSEQELEDMLRADTMREFVSYAVGCMFGRYSLDKPGLILANQGETVEDYLGQVSEPTFMPDADNVIPILDGDWFTDDIAERFRAFLRVTFGDENYEENLRFIEEALGKKGKPLPIRDYFLKEFYNDHVKRYKKRPIYWLFSSQHSNGKVGGFNALIYLHRYRPDTVSVVLNDYLRDFNSKLTARKSHLEHLSISSNAEAGEKTKALKDIESIKKILVELEDYEREVLYPLATQQREINLDDGVKYNYGLFGAALKKIAGLDAAED